MERISEKRLKGLEFSSFTRGVSLFREKLEKELKTVGVGEAIKIESSEYKMKTKPTSMITNINSKILSSGGKEVFKTRTLRENRGWVVIRIK